MKKIINTKNAPSPIGPYNQAVLVGNTLYTSGQIALNPSTGELVKSSIEEETTQVMENMKAVLTGKQSAQTYRFELSCIMNLENDAMWLHMASDDKPPFWNLFPRRSKKLIKVKNLFEKLYLLYLKYL